MKIALAQINTTVGDIEGNERRIAAAYQKALEANADVVLFPELAITGYPPRDLLLKNDLIARNQAALHRLAEASKQTAMLVGYAGRSNHEGGRPVTNSVAVFQNGKITASRDKTLLPTYDVFDEDRYFEPARENSPILINGRKVGVTVCEDIWNDEDIWPERRYRTNPVTSLLEQGAEIIFNISASPWHLGKNQTRFNLLANIARKSRRPVVYCNLVGGNDELIFDGGSLAFNGAGGLLTRGKLFAEDFLLIDLEDAPKEIADPPEEEALHDALVLGLRDYMHKCGFKAAVLGLSGGIDSALVACLAAEALGPENVHGISLPSPYSSQGSLDDARQLAVNLGMRYDVIEIEPIFAASKDQLSKVFAGKQEDVTEENLQARIRGVLLMGMSNKFGTLLLTTGNKSELAVGYCTLYGDMCGGLAVISDVPKTMVYRLSRWINRDREIIPWASITKPPSAELRPNQKDQDSLPEYEVLDAVLNHYVVWGKSLGEIVELGFDEATVRKVIRLIDLSEYKRRQAAPGLKVTTKAFGVGRRFPIAQRYREW